METLSIAGIVYDIQTEHFPNTRVGCYRYTHLLTASHLYTEGALFLPYYIQFIIQYHPVIRVCAIRFPYTFPEEGYFENHTKIKI
jgi:hypothetical protein